jgi:hypothetical protein
MNVQERLDGLGKYFNWRIIVLICAVLLSIAIVFHGLCFRYVSIDREGLPWSNVKAMVLDRATGKIRFYIEYKDEENPKKVKLKWSTLKNMEFEEK